MKKYIFVFIFLLLAATSCEDFLTEHHPSEVTTEFLYNTEDGLQAAVNALYALDRDEIYVNETHDHALILGDGGTDIDFIRVSVHTNVARYRNDISFPQQSVVASYWKKWYKIIERVNSIIVFGSQADIPEATKRSVLREAYIHRANAYFWLVRKYDNLWLNLEPTTIDNLENRNYSVASQEDVYERIIADLDTAVSYYGNNWTARIGQFGLGVALFLRIDVALWRQDYETASILAEKLINEGPYVLVEPGQVFTKDGRKNTREALYVMQWDEFAVGGGGHQRLPLIFTSDFKQVPGTKMVNEYGGYGWARIFPNEYLLSLYNPQYDKRWNAWWQHYYTYNNEQFDFTDLPYKLGDTLKYDQNSKLRGIDFFRSAGVSCKKYFDWTKAPEIRVSYNNVYIYRFAEVYLMAAEAFLRLGDEEKALYYINQLRESRISEDDPNRVLTEINLEAIVEEHARELAFEGRRWFFLKRLGLLVERVRENGGITVFRGVIAPDPSWYSARTNIQDFHVRWPIPQSEIDAMGGFPQNEEYR